jgi:hypothetical protein
MDPVALIIGVSWIALGLLVTAAAIPLVRGKVARNGLYGVRLPQSFTSDDAWYAINRFGGRRLILWAAPMIAVGIVCLFLPLRAHPVRTLILGFSPLAFILAPAIQTWRFACRYRPQS